MPEPFDHDDLLEKLLKEAGLYDPVAEAQREQEMNKVREALAQMSSPDVRQVTGRLAAEMYLGAFAGILGEIEDPDFTRGVEDFIMTIFLASRIKGTGVNQRLLKKGAGVPIAEKIMAYADQLLREEVARLTAFESN